MELLTIELDFETYDKIERIAVDAGESVDEVAANILADYLMSFDFNDYEE